MFACLLSLQRLPSNLNSLLINYTKQSNGLRPVKTWTDRCHLPDYLDMYSTYAGLDGTLPTVKTKTWKEKTEFDPSPRSDNGRHLTALRVM